MKLLTLQLLTAAGEEMAIGDRVMYALRMLVVGLGAVFAILALLWGVMVLARVLLHDIPDRNKVSKNQRKNAPSTDRPNVSSSPATPASVAPATSAAQDNGALIAVITAAISAAMQEEGTLPSGGFRVVSFRRSSNGSAWNRK